MAPLKNALVRKVVKKMQKTQNKSLILGSSSPRRRDILSLYNLDFTIDQADIDESDISEDITPEEYTTTLAVRKGAVLSKKHPDSIIISADTIVYSGNKYYGKPKNREDAFNMLKELSGKTHIVGSALALHDGKNVFTEFEKTYVTIRDLSDSQIYRYIDAYDTLDRAGGYGAQDGGGILIQKIEGNFYNVVGFEIKALEKLFAKIGLDIWEFLIKK
ncbi:MAG: dTTP/UTP pyrophosphatase [Chlamydiia bacterium]|nr:dTTP/UTP pyrophosphatase [Chlamydiia bacterium]